MQGCVWLRLFFGFHNTNPSHGDPSWFTQGTPRNYPTYGPGGFLCHRFVFLNLSCCTGQESHWVQFENRKTIRLTWTNIYILYIYRPKTQMTSVLIGQGLDLGGRPSNIGVIWVLGKCNMKIIKDDCPIMFQPGPAKKVVGQVWFHLEHQIQLEFIKKLLRTSCTYCVEYLTKNAYQHLVNVDTVIFCLYSIHSCH